MELKALYHYFLPGASKLYRFLDVARQTCIAAAKQIRLLKDFATLVSRQHLSMGKRAKITSQHHGEVAGYWSDQVLMELFSSLDVLDDLLLRTPTSASGSTIGWSTQFIEYWRSKNLKQGPS